MQPTYTNCLIGFIAVLFVAAGCQSSDGDSAKLQDQKELENKVVAQQQAEFKATAEKQADMIAANLARSALKVGEAVIDTTVPKPSWSFFPGLEGKAKRMRGSVTREKRKDGPKPVLLLMLDTTRADHLSAWGYHRPTSPNLEKLATEGIRFSRFYSNGAWTRPSVASIMTSRYRGEHGCELGRAKLSDDMVTAADVFKSNGYATSAIVGNQTVRAHYNFDQGFDHYEDIHDEIEHNPKADELVNRATKWLDGNTNPNWFMWMFLVDPHDPYNPVSKYDKWETKSRFKTVGVPQAEYRAQPPKDYTERMKALYDAEILQMDDAIGTLMEYFKKKGIWDDLTIVVVTDHGEAFGENKCFRHPYHFWEPNIHVAFMLRSPEFKSHLGTVEDRLVQGVDVAPTMLDLAGLSYPDSWKPSGISAASLLTGPITEGWNRSVYTELRGYGLTRWMVRRGDYKYLRFNPSDVESLKRVWDSSWEQLLTANHKNTRHHLFNVADDPKEETNLSKKEPEVLKAMKADLSAFRKAISEGSRPDQIVNEKFDKENMDPQVLEDLKELGYVED